MMLCDTHVVKNVDWLVEAIEDELSSNLEKARFRAQCLWGWVWVPGVICVHG
jgi:hypothetical protein